MKIIYSLNIFLVLLTSILFANAGFYQQDYDQYQKVVFNFGGSDEWKRLDTEVEGQNYGTKSSIDTWLLKGAEAFLWADGSTTITTVTLYYRIYKQGSIPPVTFNSIALSNSYHYPSTNNWRFYNVDQSINILSPSVITSPGTWYVEFYFDATTNDAGTKYWSNSGNNFKLYFTANDSFPVELSSFFVSARAKNVSLNWQTVTEVNNYGFEVERSQAPDVKSETWKNIGFVNGHGNSNSPKNYSFIDEDVLNGKYFYRLKQIDNDGKYEYSKEVEVNVESVPTEYGLFQNYPNPFNPSTTIKYALPNNEYVQLKVFNILGNEITSLVNEVQQAGSYKVEFNLTNIKNPTSGIYFYRLEAGSFVESRKMTLLK